MSTAATETEVAPEKLRVEIARGVLALLDAKEIVPSQGVYYYNTANYCIVCAQGALYASHVMKKFNLPCVPRSEVISSRIIDAELMPIFGADQFESIENWFESNDFEAPEKCMREIMHNIIENGGTFNMTRTVS